MRKDKTITKAEPSTIDGFLSVNQKSLVQEILNTLLDGDNDLDLKTHVLQPKDTTAIYLFSLVAKNLKYKKTAELIENFLVQYLRYMISYKRMSRKEVIQALSTSTDESDEAEGLKKILQNQKK